MARIQPLENVEFGGVDSRSNPINMPTNRLLRCLNWVPKQAGDLELRWGYATVSMNTASQATLSTTAYSGLIPYRQWNGSKFVLMFQGPTWSQLALPAGSPSAGAGAVPGIVTTPPVGGVPIQSSAPGNFYVFNNRIHYGNGHDQKFFDGTSWRDNGVRAPTSGETSAATVSAFTADANGLPQASVGGYQFYMAYYNPATGHVGNRIAIGGGRFNNSTGPVDVTVSGLPLLGSGASNILGDPGWVILLGRTGDGAQVPYACVDTNDAFITVPNSTTTITFGPGQASIDGNFELPTRNGQIPSAQTMFAVVGDYVYSCDPNSPTVRLSGSALDANAGRFLGRPEQSWAPNDIETFPTAEAVTGLFEVNLEAFVGTLTDCAILTDLAGVRTWRGPWPVGVAGARAGTKTDHGFFWLSGDKRLCTFIDGLPVAVSEEYEAAELAQIGDQFLPSVELRYFRNPALHKDELRIECQLADGTPYTIIHDFKLMDDRSPTGQGYSSQFAGASPLGVRPTPLGTLGYTSAVVRDGNSRMQIFAGALNGQLYQLYTGSDDAGTQFTADGIALINTGQDRPSVPWIDWYGDQNVDIQIGRVLATTLGTPGPLQQNFEDLTPSDNQEVPPGYEYDFRFRAKLAASELHHTYFRFLLTSHSADGSLSYNSPVHLPLENYGRIYALIPSLADTREQ